MSEERELARTAFDEIRRAFPDLRMEESRSPDGEPELRIPAQAGLAFELHSYLHGDALSLCAGSFWGEWFPCHDPKTVEQYREAVVGLLTGRFRVVEVHRRGRLLRSLLQRPKGSSWKTISWTSFGFPLPWFGAVERRVFRNDVAERASEPDLLPPPR